MIWFDLVTPKSVRFFSPLIRELESRGASVFLTARGGEEYREVTSLLEPADLDYHLVGEYGGSELEGKLTASLSRQQHLVALLQGQKLNRLISLCSVDACRVAFGLGIPVVNFCDLPNRGQGTPYTHVARLTLPLSRRILHPFVIPSDTFTPFVESESIRPYDFLDPVIYLKDQRPDPSLVEALGLDPSKRLVVFREEEYKASYVDGRAPFAYDAVGRLQTLHNLVILPRYGTDHLEALFPQATVLARTIDLSRLLPFAALVIGGGGTINIEAAWWGVPVISTRSFVSHYDQYLLNHQMMIRATCADGVMTAAEQAMERTPRDNPLRNQVVNMDSLLEDIMEGEWDIAS